MKTFKTANTIPDVRSKEPRELDESALFWREKVIATSLYSFIDVNGPCKVRDFRGAPFFMGSFDFDLVFFTPEREVERGEDFGEVAPDIQK